MTRSNKNNRKFFQEKGGLGGHKRARKLSPEKRTSIASHAARTRWGTKHPAPVGLSSIRFDHPKLTHPTFLEEVLLEGQLSDWRFIYQAISDQPFGQTAQALSQVLDSTSYYGVTLLWKNILLIVRGGK